MEHDLAFSQIIDGLSAAIATTTADGRVDVVRYPYMPTDVDRYMQQVAIDMGHGKSFNKAPVGVYFGTPGVEVSILRSTNPRWVTA